MSLKHSEVFVCRKALYFSSGKLHVNLMPLHYKVRGKVSKELYFCRSSESKQILCHSQTIFSLSHSNCITFSYKHFEEYGSHNTFCQVVFIAFLITASKYVQLCV